VLWVLATFVVLILGAPFFRGAWEAVRRGRANADTLVSLGALAAYAYSTLTVVTGGAHVYFDTVTMVLVLFTLGRYLEAAGRVRAARSLAPMLAAERACAIVLTDAGDVERPVDQVRAGTVVRVRPGERVPVDGMVVEGCSECNEAILSGQSDPRQKLPGANVYAGSINGNGQLLVETTATGLATRWGQIACAVREALSRKSPAGELVDRVAVLFVPAVIIFAAVTVLFWHGRGGFDQAMMAGLAVLVVACPCALGLAAPLATALGVGNAAQRGILVRGGAVLERLASVKGVAFDKTGTLTTGDLVLVDIAVYAASEAALLSRAAALAEGSEHHIARCIRTAAKARELAPTTVQCIQARPGQGVVGQMDGDTIAMGSAALMNALGWLMPQSLDLLEPEDSFTRVYIGWGATVRGRLQLVDTLVADARETVARVKALGLDTCLLSGDAPAAAQQAALAAGIHHCRADLSPSDKVEVLSDWARKRRRVAMVGDGINDGPVLAAADVGIAAGGSTDLARETADVTLPAGRICSLPDLIELSRRVRRIILSNILWAMGYNTIALSLAAAGILLPVVAAALMAGSSLLVVGNSLRAGREAVSPSKVLPTDELAGAGSGGY
ncbi:MAG: heavy metal translocating P-type ATPase, partial [Gammaproteobacteria bacterium]